MKKIKTVLENITPKKAEMFLENDTLKHTHKNSNKIIIESYAKCMKDGKWEDDGGAIVFNKKGGLMDGKDILLAIIKSGVTIKNFVVYGAGENFFKFNNSNSTDFNDVLNIESIGKELKRIKENKKLTYYMLSKKSGLTHSQIQNIENGTTSYTIESILKICRGLDIDLGKIIIGALSKK